MMGSMAQNRSRTLSSFSQLMLLNKNNSLAWLVNKNMQKYNA